MALARLPIKTVVLLLVVFLGIRFAQNFIQSTIQFKNEDTLVAYFSQFADQYLALVDLPDAETPPYLRGKLLIVDTEKGEVDRLAFFKLPEELRAKDENEVETVALIRWGFKRVGTYADEETRQETGEAFMGMAAMTLVDMVDRKVIERRTFEGNTPASGITYDGDYRSERPFFAVVEYLSNLPRR